MHNRTRIAAVGLVTAGLMALAPMAFADDIPTDTVATATPTEETTSSPDISTPNESAQPTTPPSPDGAAATPATPTSTTETSGTPKSPAAPSQPTEPTVDSSSASKPTTSPASPSSQTATPTSAAPAATKTLRWILPGGGTAENVTWPQPVYTKKNVAEFVPCSTVFTVQVDTGPYGTKAEKALADSFDDDGILTDGEDHGWVQSWYFEAYTSPTCPKVEVVPAAIVPTPPTCDTPGTLGFDLSAPTGADNGYNQYALGLRYFVSPVGTGPDTYTVVIQGVGAGAAGYEATFPYGTKVAQTTQTVTVLPATGVAQSTDPSAPCYVAPPKVDEPPAVVTPPTTPPVVVTPPTVEAPPVVNATPVVETVAAPELAHTGTTETEAAKAVLVATLGGLLLVFGALLVVVNRVRRPRYSRKGE
jgi:hypothetical protein